MFGLKHGKIRRLEREVDRNAYGLRVMKECCKTMSEELEALKNYMVSQQEQINELRNLAEKTAKGVD